MKRDTNKLFKKQMQEQMKLKAAQSYLKSLWPDGGGSRGTVAHKFDSRVSDDRALQLLNIIKGLHEYEEGDLVLKSIKEMQEAIKDKPLVEAVAFCKGRYMGMCNRKDCLQVPATWFNVGNDHYYCQPCAFAINYRPPYLCYRGHKSEKPDDFKDIDWSKVT